MTIDENKYRLNFDYHTHTIFSHGKGNIEDNVVSAIEKGLRGIAITDHGPGHLTYGMRKEDVPVMREIVNIMKEKYKEIEIYLGVEANVVNTKNFLDISRKEFEQYDFVIAGYHYGVKRGYCISNWLNSNTPWKLNENYQRNKNTEMVIGALRTNKIKILTHPGDKGPFDIEAISKVCAETGTWMEISTWHDHLTVEEIKIAAKEDVKFVISSDAHTVERIGSCIGGVERALEAGLDLDRIVNLEIC